MSEILQRLEGTIQNHRLLKRGERILVAVSGGRDSMALLHALQTLSPRHQWHLTVAHFNHQLRGRSSDADEALVRKTAARLKLPVAVGRADVKKFAHGHKLSIEMAARQLRHEFFAQTARKRKIHIVATGHHADDQVELFFLRVLRGAGGEGLAGMKRRSPSPADKTITLVRPLLDLARTDLLDFALNHKMKFREDATNTASDFLRSRIRNELIPLLQKKYQPGLARTVLRLMEIVGAEAEVVGEMATRWSRQRQASFDELPLAVQRQVLQLQLNQTGIVPDFELIEQLRTGPEKPVSVGAGLAVVREDDGKLNFREQRAEMFQPGELGLTLTARAGRAGFAGLVLDWKRDAGKTWSRSRRQTACEFFDADRVGDQVILRHWRAGDRFQPIGLNAAAKLQNLFTNQKIPREQRRNLVVATTARGEIFWVEGLRMAEHFKLTVATKRRLVWRWRPAA